MATRTVLISGAGIAGSTLAYWLAEAGFSPTVVEKASDLRRSGGHAVDLAGVGIEVVERMGLLEAIQDARVRRDSLIWWQRHGDPIRMPRLTPGMSDRHVEIQRDILTSILYQAAAPRAEYLFDDTVTALRDDGDQVAVDFAHSESRSFDLVIGADGLHSRVRQLTFGPEDAFRHDLGAYLAVYSYPNTAGLDQEVIGYPDVDRVGFTYAVDDGRQARTLLLFRAGNDIVSNLRDRQQQLSRTHRAFDDIADQLPFPLTEMDRADDFYFDAISQIRMASWSRGRVTLVGDAGYSSGPAVGGGTVLAVLGAFLLGKELERSADDHGQAFRRTEQRMAQAVRQSRKIGPGALRQLVPSNRLGVWSTPRLMKLLTRMPRSIMLAAFSLQGSDKQTLDDLAGEADVAA